MAQLGSLPLSPEEVFTLVVNTHQRNLGPGNTILGSEVRDLESGVLGDLRNLVQFEPGDLGGDEGNEDEERGEILHGHLVAVEGGQERELTTRVTEKGRGRACHS